MDAWGAPSRPGPAGHSSIFSPAKCFQSQLAGQPSPPKNRLFSPILPQPPDSETTSNVGCPSPPVSPPCRSPQKVLDWVGFIIKDLPSYRDLSPGATLESSALSTCPEYPSSFSDWTLLPCFFAEVKALLSHLHPQAEVPQSRLCQAFTLRYGGPTEVG